ncbi:uncharacterized protein LOC120254630 [Dioscorea cayenensis subsp. rotundata]|uniref:Uncharacterized protein LOC120254630 n=1 Tax=Dioscorea cayennensis subsp. rotundata TaxID=55577 RepID=A0AB40AWG6_DIOCR|nr:uncharacterized protein LOC120254630 [Dioscorea cayenensis subsp. rotundata]
MTLQLADKSIGHNRSIIEDVLLKVYKFIFPVDFMILDVDKDVNVPLILGQPFLDISQALIDVSNGRITLWVGDEEVFFALSDAMKHTFAYDDTCYFMDMTNPIVDDLMQEIEHEKVFKESLDGPQDKEILPLLKTNKVDEQTRKKHWKMVT